MSEIKRQTCVCKGIRKCIICSPDLIKLELCSEKNSLLISENLFIYCINCDKSIRVNESIRKFLIEYLDQKITKIPCLCNDQINFVKISGIYIQENFITYDEEQFLLSEINKSKWIESQSGRFKQDFGPKANFKQKKLKYSTFTGLPFYSQFLIKRLQSCSFEAIRNFVPVELCNLRYEASRGACIEPHFDDFWLWGDRLITFNLLENTFLTLKPSKQVNESLIDCQVLLPMSRYSLIALTDDARFKWMHGIKKGHIKNCRQAITIRELTNEFKNDATQGVYLERLALTFNGTSIGMIEDFLKVTKKTESSSRKLWLCEQNLKKIDIYLDKLDSYLKVKDNDSDYFFNIGRQLAKWTSEYQEILPEIINDEMEKSLETKSIQNFCLISKNFDEYCNLLRDFFSTKSLEPSLKSKIISSIYQINDFIQKLNFAESYELTNDWFNGYKDSNEFNRSFSLNKRKTYISLKFDNLALFLSKLIVKQSFDMVKIRPTYEKLVSGYSVEILLIPKKLNFINLLIFLNLVFNMPNENLLFQVENFYLNNFEIKKN